MKEGVAIMSPTLSHKAITLQDEKVKIKFEFIRQDGYICNLIFATSASQMLERVVKIDHFFDI